MKIINIIALFFVVYTVPLTTAFAQTKIHFLGIAGQDDYVFQSEVEKVKNIVIAQYNIKSKPIIINEHQTFKDIPKNVYNAFETIAKNADKENDVFFIYMTSHGNKNGFAFKKENMVVMLKPKELELIFKKNGIKNIVLVISACHSGIFKKIATDNVLIITAARADKKSFGCHSSNEWTYFGKAFFKESLSKSTDLIWCFKNASKIIRKWENDENLEFSEPQIYGGKNLINKLNYIK